MNRVTVKRGGLGWGIIYTYVYTNIYIRMENYCQQRWCMQTEVGLNYRRWRPAFTSATPPRPPTTVRENDNNYLMNRGDGKTAGMFVRSEIRQQREPTVAKNKNRPGKIINYARIPSDFSVFVPHPAPNHPLISFRFTFVANGSLKKKKTQNENQISHLKSIR